MGDRLEQPLNVAYAVMCFIAFCVMGWWMQVGHITLCLFISVECSTPFLSL
jgi:hypothetical protein